MRKYLVVVMVSLVPSIDNCQHVIDGNPKPRECRAEIWVHDMLSTPNSTCTEDADELGTDFAVIPETPLLYKKDNSLPKYNSIHLHFSTRLRSKGTSAIVLRLIKS